MKLYKILALVYNDMRIFRNMKYKPIELFYFPLITVVIWGFFAMSIQDRAVEVGLIVLIANVFWSFAQLSQSSVNRYMMEDMWSGSLKHVFVSGITSTEYIVGRMISSSIFSSFMMVLLLTISHYVFGAQVIGSHLPTILALVLLTLFASLVLSVLVSGMLFAAGREYGFLSWTAIQIFVLLSAPLYPVAVFPPVLQTVAMAMPFTYIFEGIRHLVTYGSLADSYLINSVLVSFSYLVFSFAFYTWAFKRAKRNGILSRMAG